METVAIALVLLLAVVVSGMLARMSPIALPLPLYQIVLGAGIASVADLGVQLQPDIFFLLFLPPLLFLDGWRIPKEGLLRDKGTILELALGLVVLAIGGILIGIGVTWATTVVKNGLMRRFGEDSGSQILVSLLIPFASYLVAEHLHCSGILAAVAAGITMSYAEQSGKAMAITRVRRNAVWETIQFAANGIIFVLLGEQLPQIVAGAAKVVRETGHHDPAWLWIYIVAINLALIALRLVWGWASLRFVLFRAARQGKAMQTPSWRLVVAMSLTGVRGTITLAGVMTLPLTMYDGSPFPARDLAILLAAGVIIVSLVVASVGLPHLLRNLELPPEPSEQEAEDNARTAAAEAAIRAVEQAQHEMGEGRPDADLYIGAGARITDLYRQRIEGRTKTGDERERARKVDEIERRLRLAALHAERDEIYRNARIRKLSDVAARKLVREIDLLEARISGSS